MSSQSRMYKRDRSTGTRRLANLQPSKSRVAGGVGASIAGRRGGGGIVVTNGSVAPPAPSPRRKSRGFFSSRPSPQQGKSVNSPQSQRHCDEEKGSNQHPPMTATGATSVAKYEDEKKLRKKPSQSPVVIPGGDVDGGGRIHSNWGGPLHRDATRQQPGGGDDDENGHHHHGRGRQVFFASSRSGGPGPSGRQKKFEDYRDELILTARHLRFAVVRIWSTSRQARVLGLGMVCLASLFFLLSHSSRRATTDLASLGHETARANGGLAPLGGKNQSTPGAQSGTSTLTDATVVSAKKDPSLLALNITGTSNATGSLPSRADSKAVEGTEPPKNVSPSSAATEDEKIVVSDVSTAGKGTGVKMDDDASPSKPQIRGKEIESTADGQPVEGGTASLGAPPMLPAAAKDVTSSPAGTGKGAVETGHVNQQPTAGENAAAAAAVTAAVTSTPKEKPKPSVTSEAKKPAPAVASTPKPPPKPKPDPPSFPPTLQNLAEMSVPYDPERDVPYFWHVALSGGTAMEKMFSSCFHLVQAADVHHGKKNTGDQALSVIRVYGNMYVNLDVTTREGIALAKEKNLVSSHLADVVVTTTVQETADIFTPENRGRLFTLFHHPVERAVSMFYYLQRATYDPGYNKDFANMTIVDYAKSKYVENNWMTRFLSNKRGGSITREHLDVAKEVVRRKCLIGLTSDFAASVERFEEYFGWDATRESERARECRDKLVKDRDRRHYHPTYEEGSEVWKLLASHNVLDIELHDYAKRIFQSQANLTAVA